eukprot:3561843-Heterocapsa_arctica.AAC.1
MGAIADRPTAIPPSRHGKRDERLRGRPADLGGRPEDRRGPTHAGRGHEVEVDRCHRPGVDE